MRKKIFKDLFNREIKIGDTVLNMWANDRFYTNQGDGGPGVIQYRFAKVIKFCPQSIRIEYSQGKTIKDTSIFNTHNRIIVMIDNNINLSFDEKKEMIYKEQKIIQLKRNLVTTDQTLNRTNSKIDIMEIKINN